MSRPKTVNDLSTEARQGSQVADFNMNGLPASAAVLAAIAAFLKATEALGMPSGKRYGSLQVYAVQTAEEARDALIAAQDTWDSRARAYDAVLATLTPPSEEYERKRLSVWSVDNDVPEPWTDEAAEDADGRIAALLGDPARAR